MASCLSAALEDDWSARDDPFVDVVRGKYEKISNMSIEYIFVRSKDFGLILVDLDQISFELCQAFGVLNLFVSTVSFTSTVLNLEHMHLLRAPGIELIQTTKVKVHGMIL